MNRTYLLTITVLVFILCGCKQKQVKKEGVITLELSRSEKIENKLKTAYPDFIEKIEDNYLIWFDSTKMIFDDQINNKSFDSLLNYPDIEDQFTFVYPVDIDYLDKLLENYDPGRIRSDAFLKKMYGNSEEEVKKNLVEIIWLPNSDGTQLLVTSINGVADKLQKISNELDTFPVEYKKYVLNSAGTFKWRFISGTNRLSAHSFGIAIDINVAYSNYWKWDVDSNRGFNYRNEIPLEIVHIFEKYGFIWGGKWYHYDTMHFEYRPELIH